MDLARLRLAVIQRFQLDQIHLPIALYDDRNRRKHHCLVALVGDQACHEAADRSVGYIGETEKRWSFVAEGNQGGVVVEVGSVELPELARSDCKTDVEIANASDKGVI